LFDLERSGIFYGVLVFVSFPVEKEKIEKSKSGFLTKGTSMQILPMAPNPPDQNQIILE
jgi:hypothetical protein